MKLGLLSDSHGRAQITAMAVAALKKRGCELLIHLGDVGSHTVLDELIGHNARIVFGNCDDVDDLRRYAQAMHIQVDHPMGDIHVDGKLVCFTHGHLPELMRRALAGNADYLLHGHTHELWDERRGATRIINPGALFRAPRYTAAVLDPVADSLEIIELNRALETS
jgi:putative phosphoesterase